MLPVKFSSKHFPLFGMLSRSTRYGREVSLRDPLLNTVARPFLASYGPLFLGRVLCPEYVLLGSSSGGRLATLLWIGNMIWLEVG